ITFFLLGVVLFSIGLLGEYIGRIYEQVRGRPRYLVQAVLQDLPPEPGVFVPHIAQAANAAQQTPAPLS
ncbi:MAG TPA: glycosyltransferase, partial [Thiomonas arsenitoxydans]|nr:glycosyltransferase [Thiomonas arsenitoxydans]